MNNIILIIKKNILERFSVFNKNKQFNGIPKNYIARLLFLLTGYVLFGMAIYIAMSKNAETYLTIGDDYSYFKSFMSITTFMIITFSLFKVLSDFFNAKDNIILTTFPINPEELFLGKFFGIIFSDIDFLIYLFIVMSIYFDYRGFNVLIALFSIFTYVINLIIPYAIITLILLILAKIFDFNEHKTLFNNLKYLLRFFIIGLAFFITYNKNYSFLNKDYGISSIFINAKLFAKMMTFDISAILLSGLILAFLIFLLYILSKKYYIDILYSNLNTSESSKRKKVSFKNRSVKYNFFIKELKDIFGNMVFLTNVFINTVIFSIVLISSSTSLKSMIPDDVNNVDINILMILIGASIGFLIWANNSLSTTSLSREGKRFYIIKTNPINPKDNLLGRALALFLVYIIFNLIMTIVLKIGIGISILNALMLFIGLSLSSVFSVFLGLFFENFVLNTEWENPEELNQFKITSAVEFIISIIILIIAILGLFLSLIFLESRLIAIFIFFLIIGINTFIFYILALNKYKKI